MPEHALPRTRLGRAATFAFGATLVGATALIGCGGEFSPVYGAPAAGTGSEAGSSSGGTQGTAGSNGFGGGGGPVYGAPVAGSGNRGGFTGIPVYGAAPAD